MSKPAAQRQTARKTAELEASPRPFRTHYAGLHIGACKTPQGALIAAFAHLVRGEASAATIVGPDDKDIGRMHWTSIGVSTWLPPETFARPKIARDLPARTPHRPTLQRVK